MGLRKRVRKLIDHHLNDGCDDIFCDVSTAAGVGDQFRPTFVDHLADVVLGEIEPALKRLKAERDAYREVAIEREIKLRALKR